jgi:hypothetical protein
VPRDRSSIGRTHRFIPEEKRHRYGSLKVWRGMHYYISVLNSFWTTIDIINTRLPDIDIIVGVDL